LGGAEYLRYPDGSSFGTPRLANLVTVFSDLMSTKEKISGAIWRPLDYIDEDMNINYLMKRRTSWQKARRHLMKIE